jgi:hypothetical protein
MRLTTGNLTKLISLFGAIPLGALTIYTVVSAGERVLAAWTYSQRVNAELMWFLIAVEAFIQLTYAGVVGLLLLSAIRSAGLRWRLLLLTGSITLIVGVWLLTQVDNPHLPSPGAALSAVAGVFAICAAFGLRLVQQASLRPMPDAQDDASGPSIIRE